MAGNRLTVSQVADFFDMLDEEGMALFDAERRDGSKTTIKDFFKAYYHNRICRYMESEIDIAKAKFHLLYEDNKFILIKLRNEAEVHYGLGNIDENWKSVTTTKSSGLNIFSSTHRIETNGTHTDKRGIITGDLMGSVDASQLEKMKPETMLKSSDDKIMGYLDPNTRSRQHAIHREGGQNVTELRDATTSTTHNRNENNGGNTVSSSNASQDFYNFISLTLPEIRKKFLHCFNIMFYT